MRIVFVTTHYWPSLGGVERVVKSLAHAYRAEGHGVQVVAKRFDERLLGPAAFVLRERPRVAPSSAGGVEVRQLRLPLRRRARLLPVALQAVPGLGRLAAQWLGPRAPGLYSAAARPALEELLAGADVVHVFGTGLLAVAALEAAHGLALPVAVTPFAHPGPPASELTVRHVCRAGDAILATVEADAARYRDHGASPERVHVCGVPVPALPAAELAPRPRPPAQAPVVLFLGARRADKGWSELLDCAPSVWERFPDTRFAFVGPGRGLGATDHRVLDVGRVGDPERAAWVRRATMLCLPSRWEAFGLVVAEAWSAGVPVVVSDTPVLRELVERSGGGVAVAPGPDTLVGAIVELLERPERARELGRLGRRYWERECTPAVVVRRHLEVYRELTAGSLVQA